MVHMIHIVDGNEPIGISFMRDGYYKEKKTYTFGENLEIVG